MAYLDLVWSLVW